MPPAMFTKVTGNINLQSSWNAQKVFPFSTVKDQNQYALQPQFTNGSGANEISDIYYAELAVTAATHNVQVDLTALINPFGDAWSVSLVKELLIVNKSAVSGDKIIVGGAGANPWIAPFADSGAPATATVTLGPNGWWHLPNFIDGYAVSGGSKILQFTWDGVSPEIDFDLIIKGN